ncbi:MAG TPA: ATP-binding protein [Candidatus Binatia bacterium]|nr:ATP-binding protein [Candidatus Binatia bacterium]
MSWNPLNTLTGRLVLVTVVAVVISYAAAFLLFSNERGAALRRVAETSVIERVAYTAERLRAAAPEQRAAMAEQSRDPGIRYSVTTTPEIDEAATSGAALRIARGISERLTGANPRVEVRTVERPSRRWRMRGEGDEFDRDEGRFEERRVEERGRDRAALVRVTRATISVQLADDAWLNAFARLPGPRPAPFSLVAGAVVSIFVVGLGAALVSRQIGRPLADLANAARALGSGETLVSTPVRGPADVQRASTAFNAMADRLGRQLDRQRQMLWALSHDLRTPITALKLRAELIEDEAIRQRLLAPIDEMELLTEQALSLARAGASEEQRVNVDLSEIARTLCGELQDIGLDVRAEAAQPVMAECRPSEIARALRNLAENAAKYGGGGIMRVYRNGAGEAVVEVVDEGPGVSPDQLAKLATPFFRVDAARTQANGAGLGLAIAQAITDGHGGRLEFANRSPRGLSVKLVLPG